MKYLPKLKVCLKLIMLSTVIISLLIFSGEIKGCITECAKMWALVLMPSLFPYLVFTKYISASKILDAFSLPQKIISSLCGISRTSSGIYLCSLFSGYPTGAICATQAYKNGEITLEETERLICFTNNPSPVFLISAVGGCMLGSLKDGIAIYIIQTLSAALWAMGSKKKNFSFQRHKKTDTLKTASFAECVSDATDVILKIGGYVIVSAVIGEIILLWLGRFCLGNYYLNSAAIYFVLEISNASKALSAFGNTDVVFALLCGCSAWGGVSVIMQIAAVSPKGVAVRKIVKARIVQAVMSVSLGFAYRVLSDGNGYTQGSNLFWEISAVVCVVIFVIRKILIYRPDGR